MSRDPARTNTLRATTVEAALVVLALTPSGPGVSGRILAQQTIGDHDYTLREITIPPGQATGWHYHDGPRP
ncbi:hypothetical protein a10_01155 [Streptomyces acidiscabies]|nr:hypothetical protein a10_01155 [Streptomyces acidiscabies]GAV38473.1 hypothetical protein Saa2_01353 [Streptomyces acidiscabies]